MATKVHMEALSPTMEEGQLVRWLKSEGDAIKEGDVLAEIETDKATMELVARGSGVLQNITLGEGQTAPVGQVIAVIGDGGAAAATPKAAATQDSGDVGPTEKPKEVHHQRTAATQQAAARSSAEPAGEARQQQPRAQPTQQPAPQQPEATQQQPAAQQQSAAQQQPAAQPRAGGDGEGRLKASPLARRLAAESGVELSDVSGTGPGGRITKRDIEAVAQQGAPARDAAPPAQTPAAVASGPDREEVPLTQMRKTIAKRLAQSIGPIPTFYLTIECDMSRMMELRERVNRSLEKQNIKASINDFIIKATAAALAQHPEVNASWGESAIVRHHRVHIGVAVAVEDGLITPIIHDADRKRVRDIAVEVKELAGRAREKKLKPEEFTGATFSISNLGMFGIVEFTAIINPPESGILAVGAIEEKVVMQDGETVAQPRMRMTMSCDHRVIDGATGARFLQTLREIVEDPMIMIA